MKYTKEPRDYGQDQYQLKNGKILDRNEMLKLANQQYHETKRLYNLSHKRKNGDVAQRPIPRRTRSYKYSREQAIWMAEHTPKEIAAHFNVTMQKAYTMRYYARSVYGIE